MKLDYTERLIKSLEDAPPQIRKAFNKQVRFLLEDLRHPSLRAKKYDAEYLAGKSYSGLALLLSNRR